MCLDRRRVLVREVPRAELDVPLGDSSSGVRVVEDVREWSAADHRYRVLLEVVHNLVRCHEDSVCELLVVRVPLLGGGQDLAEVVYGPLYAVYFALFRALDDEHGTDDIVPSGDVEVERLAFLGDNKDQGSRQYSLEISERYPSLCCPLELLCLFQQLVEGECPFTKPADEPTECH